MADVWFVSPQQTAPPTSVPCNILATVGWDADRLEPKDGVNPAVQLSAVPAPNSISPGDTYNGGGTETVFTVAYPASTNGQVTLTAKLFVNGNPAGQPDSTKTVTVTVTPPTPGGGVPMARAARAAEEIERAAAAIAGPVVIVDGYAPVLGDPLARVVCEVYRVPHGQTVVDFLVEGKVLSRNYYAVVLDPEVRRRRGRHYRLYLIGLSGQVLEIRPGRIS